MIRPSNNFGNVPPVKISVDEIKAVILLGLKFELCPVVQDLTE